MKKHQLLAVRAKDLEPIDINTYKLRLEQLKVS